MSIQFLLLLITVLAASQPLELKKIFTSSNTDVPAPRVAPWLSNPLIGHDGRIYTCSGKSLLVFSSNGTIEWTIPLDYLCNVHIAPVADDRGKLYLIAEGRVLKISPSNIATSDSKVEIFFGPNSTIGGSGEIVGLAISIWYSTLFITIKNRGLFAMLFRGEFLWSAGPLLYRFGYRQGCKTNLTYCYFSSAPVVDQCEGTLYVSNNEGQLYSLYIRSPHFRWIQDFSSMDNLLTSVPGNNGILYVVFPRKAVVMGLDVSTGKILWQNNAGPLSTDNSLPVVDSNGWMSIGSLDGFLYSFSPTGDLKMLLETTASNSVIQVNPVLDCSGFGVYISQTVMEAKSSHLIDNYTYISAMKPVDIVFTLLAPATGTVYWSGKYTGELSSLVSKSDLHHFVLDERIYLTFLASTRIGNTLPCYTFRQKIAWTCAQAKPKSINIYTGNERAILLLLFFQLVVLVLLAVSVHFCCIFWGKKKLQDHGLARFLEKRSSLHKKRKTFSRMILELEQKAAAEDSPTNEALEQLGEIVRAKEGVERKLSASYSLGRDSVASQRGSILPVYDRKAKSHSFSARKESVTIFNTLSDTSISEESSRNSSSSSDSSNGNTVNAVKESKDKGKEAVVEEHSEFESGSSAFLNPMYIDHRGDGARNKGMGRRRMWLKRRRTMSSTN